MSPRARSNGAYPRDLEALFDEDEHQAVRYIMAVSGLDWFELMQRGQAARARGCPAEVGWVRESRTVELRLFRAYGPE